MPQKKRGPKPANFTELGSTGLTHSHGTMREEFLPVLRGLKGIKIYREMSDNDPIIGAVLFAIQMLIRGAEWKVEPGVNAQGEKVDNPQDVDFLESVRYDMSTSWDAFIVEVLSMLSFGWSFHEIVYKRREGDIASSTGRSKFSDGLIGWRKLATRSQDSLSRWEIADDGNASAMFQAPSTAEPKGIRIPIERSLLFRTSTFKNNPEGRSALRNAYRPWYYKKKIEEVEGIGIERDLAGLPVLTPPEGLDLWNANDATAVAQKALAEDLIRSIRRDEQEGVLKPFGWELELLATGGRRNFDTSEIVARYDQRISMTLLADFIVLGHSNKFGSFALSQNKTSMFNTAIGGWLDMIRDVLNQFAIPRLFRLNGKSIESTPRFQHGPVDVPDLQTISEYIKRLTEAGMAVFPNPELQRHLMRAARFPGTSPPAINVIEKGLIKTSEPTSGSDNDDRDRTARDRPPSDTGGANPRGSQRRQ